MSLQLPPIKYDPYDRVTQRTLPNGARHWHYTHPGTSRFVTEIVVAAGSRYDPPDAPGLAHLTEHLVSKNGDVSCDEAEGWFRSVGSQQPGWCSFCSAGYGFTVYSDKSVIRRSLDIWRRILSGPIREGLDHEISVIRSELAQKTRTRFVQQMSDRRHSALFGGHPIGGIRHVLLGDPDILSGLPVSRVEAFRASLYTADRILVITAGEDRVMAEELVDEFCAGLSLRQGFSEDGLPLCGPPPEFGRNVNFREEVSLREEIGQSGSMSSARLEAMALVPPTILSDVVSVVIREHAYAAVRQDSGWAYGISLSSGGFLPYCGTKTFEVTVADPANLSSVERALADACSSAANLGNLFAAEVSGRRLNLRLFDKTAAGMVKSLTHDADTYGSPESVRDMDAAYATLTFEEYQDWCRRYFRPESFAWWLVRP